MPRTTLGYNPEQWLDDGTILLDAHGNIASARPDEGTSRMLLEAAWQERGPSVSPDGRWLAYFSDRGGSLQLYIRSWPGLTGETQVSAGDTRLPIDNYPQWSPDSRTLYYIANDRIVAAQIRSGPGPVVESRRTLPVPLKAGAILRDIHPDGRLLIAEAQEERQGQIIVVANWFTELKNRLGVSPARGR